MYRHFCSVYVCCFVCFYPPFQKVLLLCMYLCISKKKQKKTTYSLYNTTKPETSQHAHTRKAHANTTQQVATSVLAEAKENKILSYKEIFLLHEQTTLSGVRPYIILHKNAKICTAPPFLLSCVCYNCHCCKAVPLFRITPPPALHGVGGESGVVLLIS